MYDENSISTFMHDYCAGVLHNSRIFCADSKRGDLSPPKFADTYHFFGRNERLDLCMILKYPDSDFHFTAREHTEAITSNVRVHETHKTSSKRSPNGLNATELSLFNVLKPRV